MNEYQWLGTLILSIFTLWGGMRAERWKAQREDKSAAKETDDSVWARTKELIAELRAELKLSEQASIECDKRVASVRADFESELNQAYSKIKTLSKICLDQQLEMDGLAIEVSKLRRAQMQAEPLPGGRRASDDSATTERPR